MLKFNGNSMERMKEQFPNKTSHFQPFRNRRFRVSYLLQGLKGCIIPIFLSPLSFVLVLQFAIKIFDDFWGLSSESDDEKTRIFSENLRPTYILSISIRKLKVIILLELEDLKKEIEVYRYTIPTLLLFYIPK